MTAEDRVTHLRALADEHGVVLELLREARGEYAQPPGVSGVADGPRGIASVYGWRGGNLSYLAALHELGHFALGHTTRRRAATESYCLRIVEAEAEAWAWA